MSVQNAFCSSLRRRGASFVSSHLLIPFSTLPVLRIPKTNKDKFYFSSIPLFCTKDLSLVALAMEIGGSEQQQEPEEEPLVLSVVPDVEEDVTPPQPRNHTRDVHILSIAFLFVFSAYGASQNLESTVNTEEDLGTTSLGIVYVSFTLFSLFGSPMVRVLGSKKSLVLGTTGYWLFIASNLKPSWYTMVPASIYLGYAASIIWVGQGTYLTSAARSYAKDFNLHEGTVIGNFNGEFWGIFASTQVIGNLVSLVLLRDEMVGESFSGTTSLFVVFLCSMTIGTILMCFLSQRDDKKEGVLVQNADFCASNLSMLKLVVTPLLDKRMLLIIPLLTYSGLQQAFVWSEFTKYVVTPVLGVSGVGGAMAVFGTFDALCSLIAGRLTSGLPSITLTICGGAFLQILVLLWLILNNSLTTGVLGIFYTLVMAAVWGVGDGVFNTQLNALLGMLFRDDTEAAFAQLKVWQSASTAVVFFVGPYITFQAMSIMLVIILFISLFAFLYLSLCVEKAFAHES